MTDIRLLLTNDFFGSFATQRTSWGALPGGVALRATVDQLRDGSAVSAWVDVGDFAGGGPLAPATDGELSWAAAASLGFDAAIPGNHEFDFGDAPVQAWARRVDFPLIGADTELQVLDPIFCNHWTISAPNGRTAAIIGMNLAERRGRTVWDRAGDLDTAAARVQDVAKSLRGDVDHVLLAIHEGVPKSGSRTDTRFSDRLDCFCGSLRDHVDAILGAHTLMQHVGEIAGVPYIQPWALGVEVGILDIDADGIQLHSQRVSAPGDGHLGWDGPGAATLADLAAQVVGVLERPLTDPASPGADLLGEAVTAGLLACTNADVALTTTIEVGCGQVPLDGIKSYLPAGPVTEADVLRALPWPAGTRGDEVWAAELTAEEVATLTQGLDVAIPTDVPCHRALRRPGRAEGVTVVSSNYVRNAQQMLRRDVDWTPTSVGLRDGLRAFLTHPDLALRRSS
jgi:2',3'-cyclic-nucleotide 2'-phosphodiesterase (5'-nucleotidase family)